MIVDILQKSKEEKKIIGIRRYNEGDNFWCGYVEEFNGNIVQIRHFDKHGSDDGIVIELIENIESIDFDSEYERTFNYITRVKNDFNEVIPVTKFQNTENWKFAYLQLIKQKGIIFSMELNLDYVISGRVYGLDNLCVDVLGIGKLGENEGRTIYKLEDITALKISDNECKFLEELNEWRTKTSG